MTKRTRKGVYLLMSGGSLVLAQLALLNVMLAAASLTEQFAESALRIAGSLCGFVGLACAFYVMVVFPVSDFTRRVFLSIGIAAGIIGLVLVLVVDGNFPPVKPELGWVTALWASYVFVCPTLVGIALMVELWMPPNNSFKPTPLRGAA